MSKRICIFVSLFGKIHAMSHIWKANSFIMYNKIRKHSSLIQWTIAFSKKRNSSTFGLGCKTKQHKMVANIKCDADDAYNLLDMASRNEKIDTVPSIRSNVSYAKGYLLNIIDLSRRILVKC